MGRGLLSRERRHPANRLFDGRDFSARRVPVQVITHPNDEPVTAHRNAEPHAIALEPIDLRMDIRHVHIRARPPPEGSVSRPLTLAAILGRLTTGGETTRDPVQKSLI